MRVGETSSACFFHEIATVGVRGGRGDGEVCGYDDIEGS